MNRYLEILNTADELNIDLQFLPLNFPFVDEKRNGYLDCLTFTIINKNNFESNCYYWRKSKIDFINFVDIISRLNSALKKILNPLPSELTIQIDLLGREHVITRKEFWEFLLHLNPQIIKLNLAIYGVNSDDNSFLGNNNLKISLCKKCCSRQKVLNISKSVSLNCDISSKRYQVPNVLIHFTKNDIHYVKVNQWCELDRPIILLFDSELIFNQAPYTLLLLHERFRIIHNGPMENTLFNEKTEFQKENYFIILQPKGKKDFSNNQVNNSIVKLNSEKTELNLNQNVLYFKTKCDELQQKLNSSIEEVAKLKKRNADLEKLCSELKEKNNSIKKILQI
ncbi:uncharacterized protein LOC122508594 [Leptopilina heterotoma]|uniref:uncharacterized protein LOC122508594 n=1 Tax=Leptopilina heterotoma TaxID=63436 RepID=UPI001CA9091D|nr:uncharacterized protein LOC122508594 [Leptopilina heterotoma]